MSGRSRAEIGSRSEEEGRPEPSGDTGTHRHVSADPAWITPTFLAAAAVLSVLFYREFVFGPGRMLFGQDMVFQGYQLRDFALEELRAGRGLPLWNPYIFGGMPYLAILPGPLFYPSSLLYLILPLYRAIGWTFVLHTFLAGGFAYLAGRTFHLSRQASALCGLAFMFSGYVLSTLYGGHDGRMFAMTLIPLAFVCLERGLRSERAIWFVALGFVVALQALTPHVQVMYFSSLALSAFALYRLIGQRRAGRRSWPRLLRTGLLFASSFVLAAAVAAVQILPTLSLLEHAVRGRAGRVGYEYASAYGLPFQELSALLLPDLFGSLDVYWGPQPFKLHTEYLGVVPIILALVAVVARRRRGTHVTFFAIASVVGLLFALGDVTPVHGIAYEFVPLIRRFRVPVLMLGPVTFFVVLLAGIGWERILQTRRLAAATRSEYGSSGASRPGAEPGPETASNDREELRWSRVWLLSAPVLALGMAAAVAPDVVLEYAQYGLFPGGWDKLPPPELAGMLSRSGGILVMAWVATLAIAMAVARRHVGKWALVPLLLLLVADLWRVDARYLDTVDFSEFFQPDARVRYMLEHVEPGERVWPLTGSYHPNGLMHFNLPTVTGSQNFRLAWFDRLALGPGGGNLARQPALWRLFDLRFVTAERGIPTSELRPLRMGGLEGLYEVEGNLPHAFFPIRTVTVRDEQEALRRTRRLRDARQLAVVESTEPVTAGAGIATLQAYLPDELSYRVTAARPGLLFFSEIWAPDWHAYIDGQEVPVLRTNVAFRGVEVPAGTHDLRFEYRPAAVEAGMLVSVGGVATGAILLLVLGLRDANRRRRI